MTADRKKGTRPESVTQLTGVQEQTRARRDRTEIGRDKNQKKRGTYRFVITVKFATIDVGATFEIRFCETKRDIYESVLPVT